MAKEVKPGKKFNYPLQTVLKVRDIKEKKEQEQFAEKKRVYLTEKEKEDQLRTKKRGEEDGIRTAFTPGKLSDFEKVLQGHAHLGILKGEIEKQVESVIKASQNLEDQRQKLLSAMKDKKIIEKDKDNKFKGYTKAMQDLEMKFLDEIATQRFIHEKIAKEKGEKQ